MSLTFNAKTYTADSFGTNAMGYIGAAKTASAKDDLVLRRSAAKPTADFSGLARANAKLTRTLTLTGAKTPTGDAIFDFGMAVPVGAASADVDAMCNDLGAYVSGAAFKTLVKNSQISY